MALKYNNHIKIVVWQKMTEKTLCGSGEVKSGHSSVFHRRNQRL
jgi:hypothetical protein